MSVKYFSDEQYVDEKFYYSNQSDGNYIWGHSLISSRIAEYLLSNYSEANHGNETVLGQGSTKQRRLYRGQRYTEVYLQRYWWQFRWALFGTFYLWIHRWKYWSATETSSLLFCGFEPFYLHYHWWVRSQVGLSTVVQWLDFCWMGIRFLLFWTFL